MNQYYRQCQPRKSRRAPILIALVILAMIALYGWMQKRDAQPDQLSVITYECSDAPMIELDMPIQETVQL